jgi:hypothetical protein
MEIDLDATAEECASFEIEAALNYTLHFNGLSLVMSAEQFQSLCETMRPFIVDIDSDAERFRDALIQIAGSEPITATPAQAFRFVKRLATEALQATPNAQVPGHHTETDR